MVILCPTWTLDPWGSTFVLVRFETWSNNKCVSSDLGLSSRSLRSKVAATVWSPWCSGNNDMWFSIMVFTVEWGKGSCKLWPRTGTRLRASRWLNCLAPVVKITISLCVLEWSSNDNNQLESSFSRRLIFSLKLMGTLHIALISLGIIQPACGKYRALWFIFVPAILLASLSSTKRSKSLGKKPQSFSAFCNFSLVSRTWSRPDLW